MGFIPVFIFLSYEMKQSEYPWVSLSDWCSPWNSSSILTLDPVQKLCSCYQNGEDFAIFWPKALDGTGMLCFFFLIEKANI